MTLLRLTIFAVYFLIASYAPAQGVLLLGSGGGYNYADGDHTITSTITIDGTPEWLGDQNYARTPTAGRLFGESTHTHLVAHSGLTGAMIETEDFETQGAYRAMIANLWLDGAQSMDTTWSNPGLADVADGIHIDGNDCDISNLLIEGFRGVALKIVGGTNDAHPDDSGVVTLPLNRTSYVRVNRCFEGIQDSDTDSWIDHCMCDYVRGVGLLASGGNQKITNSHFYGCGDAAIRLSAEGSQVLGTDASDSRTGIDVQAAHCRIDNCYFQGNFGEAASGAGGYASIYVGAPGTIISNSTIKLRDAGNVGSSGLYKKGVDFYYHTSSFVGGHIYQTAAYTMGIDVRNWAVSVTGVTLWSTGAANNTGLNLNSANIKGQTFDVNAYGYTGTDSEAVNIANWGAGNVLRVNRYNGSGVAVRASAGWATGGGATSRNTIIIDGVTQDASETSPGSGVYGAALP